MGKKLKACPHCGNAVDIVSDEYQYYAVTCDVHRDGCGATGGHSHTKKQARKLWNRRAPVEETPVEYDCGLEVKNGIWRTFFTCDGDPGRYTYHCNYDSAELSNALNKSLLDKVREWT